MMNYIIAHNIALTCFRASFDSKVALIQYASSTCDLTQDFLLTSLVLDFWSVISVVIFSGFIGINVFSKAKSFNQLTKLGPSLFSTL